MNEKAVLLWFIFLRLELHPMYSSLSGDPLISWILTFYWLGLGLGVGPRCGSEMLVVPWVRSIRRLHHGSEHCSDWRGEIQRESWHLSWKVSWQKGCHDWKHLRKTQNENSRASEMEQRARLNLLSREREERCEMGRKEEAQTGETRKWDMEEPGGQAVESELI